VISADSRQVYKGLNIGTGKITKKEMAGVPQHLLDVANPKQRFSVIQYRELAREKISAIFSRGKLPILCGGTGFYISALVDGTILPDVPPNPKLRARLNKETSETLFNMLLKLDPRRAKTIDPKNSRRLIRAIEIAKVLGKVPNLQLTTDNQQPYKILQIGLALPHEELKKKILSRLLARLPRRSRRAKGGISQNMIAEAKQLHTKGLSWKRMEELGLEYRYLALFLHSKITKEEMVTKLQTEIWRYAKRQMTWFKRDNRIKWFKPTEEKTVERVIKKFLDKSAS
jgi:tRNA dimethylallyltransferase